MTLDANNPTIEEDDLNTTAPNPEPEAWKMPEPVFQRTSGKLPQGYEKEVMAFSAAETSVSPSSAPVATTPEPVIKPKSSALKLMLVLLGIAAMVAFLVVFLTVVYFLFLR